MQEKFQEELALTIKNLIKNSGGASDLIACALKANAFSVAEFILEVYAPELTEGITVHHGSTHEAEHELGRVVHLLAVTEYRKCTVEQLKWLIDRGARMFDIREDNLFALFSDWSYSVLKYFLELPINADILENRRSIAGAWKGASTHENARDYYELILEKGRKPSGQDLYNCINDSPETVDVGWLIEHGADPNAGPEETFSWGDQKQRKFATLVCDYCDGTSDREAHLGIIQKLLDLGADANTKVESPTQIMKYHGAVNVLDVAVDAEKEELIDVLVHHGAKPRLFEERQKHYIETMEEKLGLR